MKLKVLDLFSGIGGFSLGLERTGSFETVAFCEIDKKAQQVIKKHWPEVPIFEDVSTLSAKDLNGTIDVICGGFPCQDISLAGKGAGLAGARSGLWYEFLRLIQELNPKYIIAENVAALRSRGLDAVLRSLAEIGYDAEWHCIPASAIGAPHQRDRIWIVAYPNRNSDISTQPRSYRTSDCLSELSWEKYRTSREPSGTGNVLGGHPLCGYSEANKVAYTGSKGLEGQRLRTSGTGTEIPMSPSGGCVVREISRSSQWDTEPNVGRVANGVSGRVDRLKQLGNAVVPQIPELIGYAIINNESLYVDH